MESADGARLHQLLTMHSLPSSSILHSVALLTKTLVQLARLAKVPHLQPTFVASFHRVIHILMLGNAGTSSQLLPARWWTCIGATEQPDGSCQRTRVASKSKPLP